MSKIVIKTNLSETPLFQWCSSHQFRCSYTDDDNDDDHDDDDDDGDDGGDAQPICSMVRTYYIYIQT